MFAGKNEVYRFYDNNNNNDNNNNDANNNNNNSLQTKNFNNFVYVFGFDFKFTQ